MFLEPLKTTRSHCLRSVKIQGRMPMQTPHADLHEVPGLSACPRLSSGCQEGNWLPLLILQSYAEEKS